MNAALAGALALAAADGAAATAAKQVWRNPARRLHIMRLGKRDSPAPTYVWIIVAVAAFAVLAVVIGALVVRLKRRRAPLPAAVAHVVPAAQPTGEYTPYGQATPKPTGGYVPYNADAPGDGQVPPTYTPGTFGAPGSTEKFAPLSSVPELKSRESHAARQDYGVV